MAKEKTWERTALSTATDLGLLAKAVGGKKAPKDKSLKKSIRDGADLIKSLVARINEEIADADYAFAQMATMKAKLEVAEKTIQKQVKMIKMVKMKVVKKDKKK